MMLWLEAEYEATILHSAYSVLINTLKVINQQRREMEESWDAAVIDRLISMRATVLRL